MAVSWIITMIVMISNEMGDDTALIQKDQGFNGIPLAKTDEPVEEGKVSRQQK